MAKKPTNKPVKRRVPPRRRKSSGDASATGIIFLVALILLGFFSKESAMLVAVGILPTLVLAFTGKGDNKTRRVVTVGLTNSAGILLLLGEVWSNPGSFERIIISPNNWIIMWGSAAIGYALNYVGPMIAAIVIQGLAQDRIKNINQQKQDLVELWGHDVLGNKDDNKPDLGIRQPRRPIN